VEETPGAILVSAGRQAVESASLITRQAGDSAPIKAGDDRSSLLHREHDGRLKFETDSHGY